MKHRELTNHIKGSFLKQQYLEAFLVQSAYIESLLKVLADQNLAYATRIHTTIGHDIIAAARAQIKGMSLGRLIEFNKEAKLISKGQTKLLDKYKVRRNQVIHDLLRELKNEQFDAELKRICEQGNKITETAEFAKIAKMLDEVEAQVKKSGAEHEETKVSAPKLKQGKKKKWSRTKKQ